MSKGAYKSAYLAPNMSVSDAAAYLGVTPRTIQSMLADGRLTAYKLGPRIVRLSQADIDAAMTPYGSAS
jgi:excisionase family DNA binding protein